MGRKAIYSPEEKLQIVLSGSPPAPRAGPFVTVSRQASARL